MKQLSRRAFLKIVGVLGISLPFVKLPPSPSPTPKPPKPDVFEFVNEPNYESFSCTRELYYIGDRVALYTTQIVDNISAVVQRPNGVNWKYEMHTHASLDQAAKHITFDVDIPGIWSYFLRYNGKFGYGTTHGSFRVIRGGKLCDTCYYSFEDITCVSIGCKYTGKTA
jgi:hypothetical protein